MTQGQDQTAVTSEDFKALAGRLRELHAELSRSQQRALELLVAQAAGEDDEISGYALDASLKQPPIAESGRRRFASDLREIYIALRSSGS